MKAPFGTATLFDFHSRVARCIRSAITAAGFEQNYDPLIALKQVLANALPHRRSEVLKRRLDAFEAGDVAALCAEATKCIPFTRRPLRPKDPASTGKVKTSKPNAGAMRALAAGMPGRALRRLVEQVTAAASADTISQLQ